MRCLFDFFRQVLVFFAAALRTISATFAIAAIAAVAVAVAIVATSAVAIAIGAEVFVVAPILAEFFVAVFSATFLVFLLIDFEKRQNPSFEFFPKRRFAFLFRNLRRLNDELRVFVADIGLQVPEIVAFAFFLKTPTVARLGGFKILRAVFGIFFRRAVCIAAFSAWAFKTVATIAKLFARTTRFGTGTGERFREFCRVFDDSDGRCRAGGFSFPRCTTTEATRSVGFLFSDFTGGFFRIGIANWAEREHVA